MAADAVAVAELVDAHQIRYRGAEVLGIGEQANLENVIAGKADGQRSWLRRWGAESLRAALDAMPTPPDSRYERPDSWITDPAENINWVHGPGSTPQTWLPPSVYLAMLMAFFPIVVYLPTHILLLRFRFA